ncbi:hypothetical protein P6P90_13490 [Ectobacillus antri]|uniref:Uncharacterized protein n=1 Tax=Ectobacillus antri TaxID=2486280 RepID=A0ABT6H9D9_9BACI|nr:hypothetical protein [Ectobacillus antri]MDG4657945.1 hypothetical protein [Ectobacillus antri]MDG5754971.1 hypothetical protein [Ectobacillus antri]
MSGNILETFFEIQHKKKVLGVIDTGKVNATQILGTTSATFGIDEYTLKADMKVTVHKYEYILHHIDISEFLPFFKEII